MNIISFSGVDGSGKSTQRILLQKYLEALGQKVAYFHATEFSLANRLQRSVTQKKSFSPGEAPPVTRASFLTVVLRLFFLFVDGIRFHAYRKSLERTGVTTLISDRFFQDSLINAAFLSRNFFIRFCIRILSKILPAPEQSFYLKISLEDLTARARTPEQGEQYIQEKILLYNNPPFSWAPHILDGAQSPESIHQSVTSLLKNT